MTPPDENTDFQPSGKKTGIIMAILLFSAILVIAFFAYLKSQDINIGAINLGQLLSSAFKEEKPAVVQEVYELEYDSKERPVFGVYKNYIVKCSSDGIRLLDKKGQEVWSEGVPLINPLVRTNGSDLLVADIGGRDIYVINGQDVRWNTKTDVNILNADISKDGHVAVITESKRDNGEVRVFDTYGIELFRNIIASNFAVAAKISPSSKQMVIDSINITGVKSNTYVKFYDMSGNELAGKNLEPADKIYPVVWYSEDDSLFVAGDTSIMCFDKERNVKWVKEFSHVSSTCITGGKHLAAATESAGGTSVKVFAVNGQELASWTVGNAIRNISAFGGIIAVNTLREVTFFTEKGKVSGKYSSRSDILDVYFLNKQQAVVVTKGYTAVININ